jgi:hypothetical protein
MACSGAMYTGVPITAPVAVRRTLLSVDWMNLEIPKSMILTKSGKSGFCSKNTFSGFMSRWMMPLAWAADRPRRTCRTIGTARAAAMGPVASAMSARLIPTRSSITR